MASKKTGLIAGGVALAVVVGGGAYAASQFFGEHDLDMATVTPASSLAYMELDLDPSGMQKIKGYKTYNKINEIVNYDTSDKDKKTFEEAVYEMNFKGVPVDEIKEWQTGQISMAFFSEESKTNTDPAVAIIYEITDKEKAEASVKKVSDQREGHYEYFDDHLVVTPDKKTYDLYAKKLEEGTLDKDDNFSSDRKKFDDNFMFGWADVGKIYDSQKESYKELGTNSGLPASEVPDIDMRLATSLAFEDSSLDFTIKAFDVKVDGKVQEQSKFSKAPDQLGELSAQTIGGISVSDPNIENFADEWTKLIIEGDNEQKAKETTEEISNYTKELFGVEFPEGVPSILGTEYALGIDKDYNLQGIFKGETKEAWSHFKGAMQSEAIQVESDDLKTTVNFSTSSKGNFEGKLSDHELFTKAIPDADKSQVVAFLDVDKIAQSEGSKIDNLGAIGFSAVNDGDGESTMKLRWTIK